MGKSKSVLPSEAGVSGKQPLHNSPAQKSSKKNLDFVAAVPPRSMNYNYSADVSSSTRVIFFWELHEKLKEVNLFVCF